jgi:GT2 family glycosyltransferase
VINLVNVVIACHNSELYLAESVESVILQSCKNFDITIVNDGSTDKTKRIAESLIEKYPYYNIELLYTPDIGPVLARTVAVSNRHDPYILFLDADDKIHPDFLEKTLKVLKENPEKSFCYTDTQHFGISNGFWEQSDYSFYKLILANFVCYCSLIRRKDFEFIGGYDKNNYGYFEDYQLWLALGRKGLYGIHLPEKLFYYRMSETNATNAERVKKFSEVYKLYIVSQYPEIFPVEWVNQSKQILSKFPDTFISMNHKQQEDFING